jgi:hypothetical protein
MRQKTVGRKRRSRWFGLIVGLLLLGLRGSALAQQPERQRAFVYGINAALDNSFTGSFAPPSVRAIYLLANQTNIISPRMTEIYFWPITNEYKASWELLNQPVAGSLEISRNGQVIQQTEATSYTLNYTPRGTASDVQLFIGADADAAQARFVARQKAYQEALNVHYKAQLAWRAAIDEANRRSQAGEQVTLPPEPQAPEPIGVVSNGVNQGIPINLPIGSYQMRLRGRDGAIVPDSERALVVFAPRRSAIGYMVVPETRWTTPDQVTDPSDVIVGKAGSQLYLIPHFEREYPARSYNLLQNPQQQVSETADWTWVIGESITAGQLELIADGQAPERRALTPYQVKQVPGTVLGYQIQPFTPDPRRPNAVPDLVGYPIQIEQPGSRFEIRMVSPQGEELPGSARLVRTPATTPLSILMLLSLAPLVVGAVVIVRRRMKLRLPRNIAG